MSKSWIGFLRSMAWINAIAGIIGSISYWCLFGTVERTRPGFSVLTETVLAISIDVLGASGLNWPAIGIGCAILIGSLTFLGFLMVICYIAEELSDISYNSEKLSTHFMKNRYKKVQENG